MTGEDQVWELADGWRFGGEYTPGAEAPGFDDRGFEPVTVPHCAVPLGWRDWEPTGWERVWIYRRRLELPESLAGRRWQLEFDGVLSACTIWLNGVQVASHAGGYLPIRVDLSEHARPGENLLAVVVDGRWQNVPPQGRPGGAPSIDFLEPAGVYREVRLRGLPPSYLDDVFVVGRDVLGPDRRLHVSCTVHGVDRPGRLRVSVFDGHRVVSQEEIDASGDGERLQAELGGLENLALWDIDSPTRYRCQVQLRIGGEVVHARHQLFGLRDARFELDGFFLNGRRLQLRGLNRHQLFPFRGMAMPRRAQRRDAEILKKELHCNVVRCSHYPESPHFLDACDELGLLVWDEVPGWGWLGDDAWQAALLRDVGDLVRRDRNRPSVVIWGVRANESPNNPELYRKAKRIADDLDGTRATSGSMVYYTTDDWVQDVFAFDDYGTLDDGIPSLKEPLDGVPYLVSEAVGALSGHRFYRRDDPQQVQQDQAVLHARVIDKASSTPRYAGLIGWCGVDYASVNGNVDRHIKWPGVLDCFREPKRGAAIYRSQVSPAVEVVIEPAFYWYVGERCSVFELEEAMICSNCDELRILLDGQEHARLAPDRGRFAHLDWPPFFLDVSGLDRSARPDLEILGYVDGRLAARRRFASDTRGDRLDLVVDDTAITADGVDATRVVLRVVDRYGAPRPVAEGTAVWQVDGPGELIGERESDLGDTGPCRAGWLRGRADRPGMTRVRVTHPLYRPVEVEVRAVEG